MVTCLITMFNLVYIPVFVYGKGTEKDKDWMGTVWIETGYFAGTIGAMLIIMLVLFAIIYIMLRYGCNEGGEERATKFCKFLRGGYGKMIRDELDRILGAATNDNLTAPDHPTESNHEPLAPDQSRDEESLRRTATVTTTDSTEQSSQATEEP